jgi:hypothetical protein
VKAIRAARKASNKGANKIDGIRAIRQTLDKCGLLEAKELYENLIDGNWHVPATDLAERWCETHWMLDDDCSCAIGAEEVKKAVADGLNPTRADMLKKLRQSAEAPLSMGAKDDLHEKRYGTKPEPQSAGEPTLVGWTERQAMANTVEFLRVYMAEVRRLNPGVEL